MIMDNLRRRKQTVLLNGKVVVLVIVTVSCGSLYRCYCDGDEIILDGGEDEKGHL